MLLTTPLSAFAERIRANPEPLIIEKARECYTDTIDGDKYCKGDVTCDCYYPSGNSFAIGLLPAGETCESAYDLESKSCTNGGNDVEESKVIDVCMESGRQAVNPFRALCKEGFEFYGDVQTVADNKDGDCCTRTVSYQCCKEE